MKQKGFILIVSLIFLVILSMFGIAMFSGVSMDERMSGNQREKSRSLDAAQAALDNAANWLKQPINSGIPCVATTPQPNVCTNELTNPDKPENWTTYASFQPQVMDLTTGANTVNTYVAQTQYYIQFLGYVGNPTNNIGMYRVTAAAKGGNSTATSVVQAVYQVQLTSKTLME
jgi:type IV pilus assembly protein PilX